MKNNEQLNPINFVLPFKTAAYEKTITYGTILRRNDAAGGSAVDAGRLQSNEI